MDQPDPSWGRPGRLPMPVMISGEWRLQNERKLKELQMDTRPNPQARDKSAEKPTGCCGGKADAQPQAKAEQRAAELAEVKLAKSGCCCGRL